MQTAREFLDDERDLFITSQTEAGEYYRSHLNESIQQIREDFQQLNRAQLKQLENEFEEKLRWLGEFSSSSSSSEIVSDDPQRVEREQWENESRLVTQELNIVNAQYQTLTQRVQQMVRSRQVDFLSSRFRSICLGTRSVHVERRTSTTTDGERSRIRTQSNAFANVERTIDAFGRIRSEFAVRIDVVSRRFGKRISTKTTTHQRQQPHVAHR